jgi:hypothetical protein
LLIEARFEEREEIARVPKSLALPRADVLDKAAQAVTLWIVVPLGGDPDPDHEGLHPRDDRDVA